MPPANFSELVGIFLGLIWTALPVLLGLALLAFLWGLVKFIFRAGGDQDIAEGKKLILWGLIALFVLMSFWGIILFFQRDIFGGTPGFPFLPTGS